MKNNKPPVAASLYFRVCAGFTLVELIVVIAVIAVLIAMLLPSMAKIRLVAKSVLCSSNLRQLMLATVAYTSSNKNQIPPYSYDGGYEGFYGIVAEGYLHATYYKTGRWGNVSPNFAWESNALFCPVEDNRTIAWPSAPGTSNVLEYTTLRNASNVNLPMVTRANAASPHQGLQGNFSVRTHYACNGFQAGSTQKSIYPFANLIWTSNAQASWRYDGILTRLDGLRNPSDTFMQSDSYGGNLLGIPVFRHPSNAINMSFADGHVIAMRVDEMHMANMGTYAIIDDQRLYSQH